MVKLNYLKLSRGRIMKKAIYDHGYGEEWKDVYVYDREGYYTSVADFHEHDFYEINLILSGNVKILVSNQVKEGIGPHVVVTPPDTPHFIMCKPDTLYRRIYLNFSRDFAASSPELLEFFSGGSIMAISPEQSAKCKQFIELIADENDLFRQRMLTLYLLSYMKELSLCNYSKPSTVPSYIINALAYIDKHFHEKIVASDLASRLYISRTTLMLNFKKHTGTTLSNYILHCRLKHAVKLLYSGKTEQEVAELCGLNDASGLICCFKRVYGMSPRKYLSKNLEK